MIGRASALSNRRAGCSILVPIREDLVKAGPAAVAAK